MNKEEIKKIEKLENIKIEELLGKGGYGVVYSIKENNHISAVKFQYIDIKDKQKQKMVSKECLISKSLMHHNIIKTYSIRYHNITLKNQPYVLYSIYMEKGLYQNLHYFNNYFQNSNLMKLTLNKKNFSFLTKPNSFLISFFLIQLIDGFKLFFESNLLHRDIKLDNIICCANFMLKFCDFGLVKNINKDEKYYQVIKSTWTYQHPDVYQNENKQIESKEAFKYDYFSFGIIIYYLLFNTFLFPKEHKKNMNYNLCIDDIKKGKENINNLIKNKFIDEELGRFTYDLLNENVETIPDIKKMADNEYFNNKKSIINKKKNINQNLEIKFFVEFYKNENPNKRRQKYRL